MSALPPLTKKAKFVQQKLCFRLPTANPQISISTATVTATTTTSSLSSLDTAATATTSASSVITESESAIVSCPEEPYHPPRNFTFPKTIQSKVSRSCHAEWFENWNWLHYVPESDSMYCYLCLFAALETRGLLTKTCKRDAAFVTTGFRYWKHASEKFNSHGRSETHKTRA